MNHNKFKDSYPIKIMCSVLGLNRSTYYKDAKRKPTKTQISNDELDSNVVKHTEGIIIQSDLGCQYTSNLFESALAELKIRHSYSKKGYPYDNSCIESWYNRKRIHSSLNYRPASIFDLYFLCIGHILPFVDILV